MKLSRIIEILDASLHSGHEKMDMEVDKIGASDLMSDILAAAQAEGSILLTGLTNVQAIKTAVISGADAIVFVRNKRPPQELIDLAESHGIPLLSTPWSMFVSSGRLYAHGFTGLNGAR